MYFFQPYKSCEKQLDLHISIIFDCISLVVVCERRRKNGPMVGQTKSIPTSETGRNTAQVRGEGACRPGDNEFKMKVFV